MISVAFEGLNPYRRKIMINGDLHHIDTLELSGDTDPQTGSTVFNNFIIQRTDNANEFFLGSYRGVHSFFNGFIYAFEYSTIPIYQQCVLDSCTWCASPFDSCMSMCGPD